MKKREDKGKPRGVYVELAPGVSVTQYVHAQVTKLAATETDECVEPRPGNYRPNQQYRLADGTLRHNPIGRLLMMHRTGRVLSTQEYAVHSCHNKRCCNPRHLSVGDPVTNSLDTRRAAHQPRRLNDARVTEIRQRLATGEPRKQIASSMGLSYNTVRAIDKGLSHSDRMVRISDEQIEQMRADRAEGATYEKLAMKFGTSIPHAFNIVRHNTRSSGGTKSIRL